MLLRPWSVVNNRWDTTTVIIAIATDTTRYRNWLFEPSTTACWIGNFQYDKRRPLSSHSACTIPIQTPLPVGETRSLFVDHYSLGFLPGAASCSVISFPSFHLASRTAWVHGPFVKTPIPVWTYGTYDHYFSTTQIPARNYWKWWFSSPRLHVVLSSFFRSLIAGACFACLVMMA
jgi:hypothetical protein